MFTVWTEPAKKDQILEKLQRDGIGVAVNYRAVHLLKFYRKTFDYKEGRFPNAEWIGNSTISIPLYPKLTDEEINYVIKNLIQAA